MFCNMVTLQGLFKVLPWLPWLTAVMLGLQREMQAITVEVKAEMDTAMLVISSAMVRNLTKKINLLSVTFIFQDCQNQYRDITRLTKNCQISILMMP